jgi:2,5-diketo-D-gluconate reductase B
MTIGLAAGNQDGAFGRKQDGPGEPLVDVAKFPGTHSFHDPDQAGVPVLDYGTLRKCSELATTWKGGGAFLQGEVIRDGSELSPVGSLRLVLFSLRSAWKALSILPTDAVDASRANKMQARLVGQMSKVIEHWYEWSHWSNGKREMDEPFCGQFPGYDASDPPIVAAVAGGKYDSNETRAVIEAYGTAIELLRSEDLRGMLDGDAAKVDAAVLSHRLTEAMDLAPDDLVFAPDGTSVHVVTPAPAEKGERPAIIAERLALSDGSSVPLMGFGTGCPRMSEGKYENADEGDGEGRTTKAMVDETIVEAIATAMRGGVTFFDTAELYDNFWHLRQAMGRAGVAAEGLQFMSKVDHTTKQKGEIRTEVQRQLKVLNASRLEILMIHHPADDALLAWEELWREMEALVDEGLVRALGWSFTTSNLLFLLQNKKVRHKPVLIQMQGDLSKVGNIDEEGDFIRWAREHGIGIVSVSSVSTPDIIPGWLHPFVQLIAANHNVSAASVSMRWAMQLGMVVIPCSMNPAHVRVNLEATRFRLTNTEMALLNGLPWMTGVCPAHARVDVMEVGQAVSQGLPGSLKKSRCCSPAGVEEEHYRTEVDMFAPRTDRQGPSQGGAPNT